MTARARRRERARARGQPVHADVEARRQGRSGGVHVESDEFCTDSEISVNTAEREGEEQRCEAGLAEQLECRPQGGVEGGGKRRGVDVPARLSSSLRRANERGVHESPQVLRAGSRRASKHKT
eukprot:6211841-Pleurochrysis_carterae.AAC.4